MSNRAGLLATTSSFAHLMGRQPPPAAATPPAADPPADPPGGEPKPAPGAEGNPPKPGATNDKQQPGESDEHFRRRYERDTAEDDEPTQGDDESDEDFQKRKKKWQDDQEARSSRALSGLSADRVGGDRSDTEDMRTAGLAAARSRERTRCAAIFLDPAAAFNPAIAASLAFETDLPRGAAVKVLRNAVAGIPAATGRNTLDRRMAELRQIPVAGPDAPQGNDNQSEQTAAADTATQIVVAGMVRRGESDASIQAFVATRKRA